MLENHNLAYILPWMICNNFFLSKRICTFSLISFVCVMFKDESKTRKQIPMSTTQEATQGLVGATDTQEQPIPRYSWDDVTPGQWKCACIWRIKRRKLRKDGHVMPVMVKQYASKHERYLLWQLKGEPGIPRLVGITNAFPYALLMEVYPGRSFRCQRHFSSHWKCLFGLQRVCEVVSGLHAQGITHGDLRDRNIVFAVKDGDIKVTILHFDRGVRLKGLSAEQKYPHIRRDLRQIYKLLTRLRGLFCVGEYVGFVKEVRTRLKDDQPLSALQIASGIAYILSFTRK